MTIGHAKMNSSARSRFDASSAGVVKGEWVQPTPQHDPSATLRVNSPPPLGSHLRGNDGRGSTGVT